MPQEKISTEDIKGNVEKKPLTKEKVEEIKKDKEKLIKDNKPVKK